MRTTTSFSRILFLAKIKPSRQRCLVPFVNYTIIIFVIMVLKPRIQLALTLFVTLCHNAVGIDLNGALRNENIPCFAPRYTQNVNNTWLAIPRTWFFPSMSVLNLYMAGLGASGREDAADLTEDELYYYACMTFNMTSTRDGRTLEGVLTGFGGTQSAVSVEYPDDHRTVNLMIQTPQGMQHMASAYVTLTNNQTFIFLTTCRQGRMTWEVVSTVEPLSEEDKTSIEEHAESLGFKKEFFTSLRYDSCPAQSRHRQSKNNPRKGIFRGANISQRHSSRRQQQWGRGDGFGWI